MPICQCDFKVDFRKKTMTIKNLLMKVYGNKIKYFICDKDTGMLLIQINKDQVVNLEFAGFDTWDKIKSKVEKLLKSDGICVVCMEKEKGKKKMIKCCDDIHCSSRELRIITTSYMCSGCCELLCFPCYRIMNNMKCPVCRQCLDFYSHKLKREKCDCIKPEQKEYSVEEMMASSDEYESSDESDAASP